MLVVYDVDQEFFLAVFPKAGWQSIRDAMKRNRMPEIAPDVLLTERGLSRPLTCFLRHPLARLTSAWRYFHPHARFGADAAGLEIPRGASYETFVDAVLRGVKDPHWDPQLPRLPRRPDIVYRFENIQAHWPRFGLGDLPHLNASADPLVGQDPTYREQELREHYALDLAVWESSRAYDA
ncbi:MAG: hypothetical protein V2J24_23580 [Pseudomonadales bacterium]|jgi:hypothetical protein|nr:hypothetical protein [Pseudomonadales bacterium]